VEDHISKTWVRLGEISQKMVTLTKAAREFGFWIVSFNIVDLINTPSTINSNWFLRVQHLMLLGPWFFSGSSSSSLSISSSSDQPGYLL
jgi:hypothetical protein